MTATGELEWFRTSLSWAISRCYN